MRPSAVALALSALFLVSTGAYAGQADSATPQVSAPPTTLAPLGKARPTGFHTLFRDLAGDLAHVPSRDSLMVAAIGGGAALAVHPLDGTFNQHLQGTSFFNAGNRLGNTATLMGATFAVYSVGLATGHHATAHVALDLVRAEVVSEGMVEALKLSAGRQRPDGSNNLSFPSGHTAVSMAMATVLQRHYGLKWALPAYGLAAYVAMSRLHDNVHYLSDVVFGAAAGEIAGRTVTRHGPKNFAVVPAVIPGGAGLFFVRLHSATPVVATGN